MLLGRRLEAQSSAPQKSVHSLPSHKNIAILMHYPIVGYLLGSSSRCWLCFQSAVSWTDISIQSVCLHLGQYKSNARDADAKGQIPANVRHDGRQHDRGRPEIAAA